MSIDFVDSEIEKIDKGIIIQYSTRASMEESSAISGEKIKRKLLPPDFKVGDIFSIRDKKYVIINVETKLLILVIAKDWRKEGYSGPEEAKKEYKRKGYFGERVINGELRFVGDDDYLTYMHTYTFIPISIDLKEAEFRVQQIMDKYKEEAETRKLNVKERKKDEAWIKSHPECFVEIMNGLEVDDIKRERQWSQWERSSRRKVH